MEKNTEKRNLTVMGAVSAATNVGVNIASCIIIGVLVGKFLDRIFGISPKLLIVFSILGVLAAVKTIMGHSDEERQEQQTEEFIETPIHRNPETQRYETRSTGEKGEK